MMNVEKIAEFYVDWVEPGLKVFAMFMIVMAVIYVLSFIKDPKKQLDIATQVMEFFYKMVLATLMGIFHALVWFTLFIWRSIHIIFATIRDFFVSRI